MKRAASFLTLAFAAAIVACGGVSSSTSESGDDADDGATAMTVESIIGGTPATAYPEAAVLDIDKSASGGSWWACSGTLIAPRVVLTAGHCVDGHKQWNVYVHNEMRSSSSGVTYDWKENGSETVNPQHHDLGLVFFDVPILIATYPTIPSSAVPDATKAVNIGRILNGTLMSSSYQAPATITSAKLIGYPFDYFSSDVIQPGDSGGAVMVAGTHSLVAVNSGAGSGFQVLARTDLLAAWIKAQVDAHSPSGSAPDAGVPASPPPVADAGSGSDAGSSDKCVAEKEPNNEPSSANALGASGRVCGSIGSTTDVDWVSFTAPIGATKVSLVASGDSVFAIGRLSAGKCAVLAAGQKTARITVSGGSAALCAQITSPSHKTQTYTFTAVKD